jgi:hypothetical protein
MANDLWGGEVSKEQVVEVLESITGRHFSDLGMPWSDSTIGAALSNANGTDRGPLGSCVFLVAGEAGNRCLDNLTQDQAARLSGQWDQFRSCDLRHSDQMRAERPAETPPAREEPLAAPAAPTPRPAKPKRHPAKVAKKKPVKKRPAARAVKRAPAAARTKPKRKSAAKAKRRVAKAAGKRKAKPEKKKAKRR